MKRGALGPERECFTVRRLGFGVAPLATEAQCKVGPGYDVVGAQLYGLA